jgi:hypothetical protein
MAPDADSKAQASRERALAGAPRPQTKSQELRAAMSMTPLWRDPGKRPCCPKLGLVQRRLRQSEFKGGESVAGAAPISRAGSRVGRRGGPRNSNYRCHPDVTAAGTRAEFSSHIWWKPVQRSRAFPVDNTLHPVIRHQRLGLWKVYSSKQARGRDCCSLSE